MVRTWSRPLPVDPDWPVKVCPSPSSATEGRSTDEAKLPNPDRVLNTAWDMAEAMSGVLREGLVTLNGVAVRPKELSLLKAGIATEGLAAETLGPIGTSSSTDPSALTDE